MLVVHRRAPASQLAGSEPEEAPTVTIRAARDLAGEDRVRHRAVSPNTRGGYDTRGTERSITRHNNTYTNVARTSLLNFNVK